MSFVSKRDSYDLQNFINRPFEFHIVLYNYDKAVSDYGTLANHCLFSISRINSSTTYKSPYRYRPVDLSCNLAQVLLS